MSADKTVLVTGASGYVGSAVLRALSSRADTDLRVIATDVRETIPDRRLQGVDYRVADVRADEMRQLISETIPNCVVHLASIVTPGKDSKREFEYSVDVLGTENVLKACVESNVGHIIVTSSGAAYGYHSDNPQPLRETDALRGNEEFAYSHHKRLVEEMLARYRADHPQLKQLIFRPGTILGENTNNQITRLWDGKFILGFWGSATPYVFIWDEDVVACIVKGIVEQSEGIFNLAGDGTMTSREIARAFGKTYLSLPVSLVKCLLWASKRLGLSQFGPEQTGFLQYRPVLNNEQLKHNFGYVPRKTTREVFDFYAKSSKNGD
jgi:UDP-glucose 4-epimerase